MSTPIRVAAFVASLAVAFLAAWGIGRAVDPIARPEPAAHGDEHTSPEAEGSEHIPGGLMVSQDGYTLDAQSQAAAGTAVPISFRITDPEGETLTAYDVEHEKQLHLIAVRRDFSGFQHVHPELHSSGTWLTELDLTPGQWRLFADFKPAGGEGLTLGTDLLVPGRQGPTQPTDDTRTAEVDGYVVELAGVLSGGTESELTLSVSKDGRPIRTEQYLGAAGHLVALREGDLAYLHVHPESVEDLVFVAEVPSAGRYHLFLDFQVDGAVRTAAFAVTAEGAEHGH